MLILYNVQMDMAGPVDFSAANARSSAQLRVKGLIPHTLTSLCVYQKFRTMNSFQLNINSQINKSGTHNIQFNYSLFVVF